MKPTKYKPGDKVVALHTSGPNGFIAGQVYTVKSHRDSTVLVEVDSQGSTGNGWHQDFFAPYVSPDDAFAEFLRTLNK